MWKTFCFLIVAISRIHLIYSTKTKCSRDHRFDIDCNVFEYKWMECWWKHLQNVTCFRNVRPKMWYTDQKENVETGEWKFITRFDKVDEYDEQTRIWKWPQGDYLNQHVHFVYAPKYRLKVVLRKVECGCQKHKQMEITLSKYLTVGPVQFLNSTGPLNSTAVELSWDKLVLRDTTLIYSIAYRCTSTFCTRRFETLEVSDVTSLDILGLTPFATYTFSVRVRAKGSKYGFSEESSVSIHMPSDVPAANPEIVEGGFYLIPPKTDLQFYTLEVYWKPIPIIQRQSDKYEVKAAIIPDVRPRKFIAEILPVKLTWSYRQFHLSRDGTHTIQIWSETDVGLNKSLLPAEISNLSLSRLRSLPQHPEHFRAIRLLYKRTVLVKWDRCWHADSITVYWCKNVHAFGGKQCRDQLKHKHLPGNSTELTLDFTNEKLCDKTIFAIGVKSKNLYSGIHWSRCLYKQQGVPVIGPIVEIQAFWQSAILSVVHQNCSMEVGYIERYIIVVSPNNATGGVNEKKETIYAQNPTLIIDNLDIATQYRVKIFAMTSAGKTGPTREMIFCTKTKISVSTECAGLSLVYIIIIIIGCVLVCAIANVTIVYFMWTLSKNRNTKKQVNDIEEPAQNGYSDNSKEKDTFPNYLPMNGKQPTDPRDEECVNTCVRLSSESQPTIYRSNSNHTIDDFLRNDALMTLYVDGGDDLREVFLPTSNDSTITTTENGRSRIRSADSGWNTNSSNSSSDCSMNSDTATVKLTGYRAKVNSDENPSSTSSSSASSTASSSSSSSSSSSTTSSSSSSSGYSASSADSCDVVVVDGYKSKNLVDNFNCIRDRDDMNNTIKLKRSVSHDSNCSSRMPVVMEESVV